MRVLMLLLQMLLLSETHPGQTPATDIKAPVALTKDTQVIITSRRDVFSNTVVVDERLPFEVVEEVQLSGHVLIARGAEVEVRVRVAKPPADFGRAGELVLEIVGTTAVDGSVVSLDGEWRGKGDSHRTSTILLTILGGPLGGRLREGSPAILKAGTRVTGRVIESVEVTPIRPQPDGTRQMQVTSERSSSTRE